MSDPNPYAHEATSRATAAIDMIPITPDDDNDLQVWAKALWLEFAADLTITTHMGRVVTIPMVKGPNVIGARRVHATGTGAVGRIFGVV